MVSDFVMTQKDVQAELTKPDAIGMGSYNSDSHNVQRFVNAEGNVENEGDMQVPVQPYQIPYRVMIPKRAEATNLVVLRMEPQYMIIGQAAGVAVAMALNGDQAVHYVDTEKLTARLKEQGAVMEYHPAATSPAFFQRLWITFHPEESRVRNLP